MTTRMYKLRSGEIIIATFHSIEEMSRTYRMTEKVHMISDVFLVDPVMNFIGPKWFPIEQGETVPLDQGHILFYVEDDAIRASIRNRYDVLKHIRM